MGKNQIIMQELHVIKEALNIANKAGAFTLDDSSKVAQCLGIVEARLSRLQELEKETEALKEDFKKVEGRPDKIITK